MAGDDDCTKDVAMENMLLLEKAGRDSDGTNELGEALEETGRPYMTCSSGMNIRG